MPCVNSAAIIIVVVLATGLPGFWQELLALVLTTSTAVRDESAACSVASGATAESRLALTAGLDLALVVSMTASDILVRG